MKYFSSYYSLEGGGLLSFVKYSSSSFHLKKKKVFFSFYYSLEGVGLFSVLENILLHFSEKKNKIFSFY